MDNSITSMIEQFIPQMDLVEKGYLLKTFQEAIGGEFDGGVDEEGDSDVCPRCECHKTMRKGKISGPQRRLRKGCGRTGCYAVSA